MYLNKTFYRIQAGENIDADNKINILSELFDKLSIFLQFYE